MEAQDPGRCPSGSMTDMAGAPGNQQHHQQPWPIFWTRADDARLVGKMLHWRDTENKICAEALFHLSHRMRLRGDNFFDQIWLSKPHYLPGAWTSIISNWGTGQNYYHWFCDCLTRLAVREKLPEKTNILINANPSAFAIETMEMLGLSDITLASPSSCVIPERYYFCPPSAMTGVWNPYGWNWLREKFDNFRQPTANACPIFLTRRGTTRIPAYIAEIESIFIQNGFEIIDCGKHTVREQIRLASAAPAIAGLHGAAMTNLLWAQPGTPVLEVFEPGYLNACYEQIAFQGKLKYKHLILVDEVSMDALKHWLTKV